MNQLMKASQASQESLTSQEKQAKLVKRATEAEQVKRAIEAKQAKQGVDAGGVHVDPPRLVASLGDRRREIRPQMNLL